MCETDSIGKDSLWVKVEGCHSQCAGNDHRIIHFVELCWVAMLANV